MSKMDDYRFREEQVEKLKLKVRLEFEVAIASERTSAKKLRERLMQLDDEETALVKKNLRSVLNDAVLKRELERIERERIEAQTALAMFENLDVSPEDAVGFAEGYLLSPSSVWKDSDLATQTKLQWFQFPSGLVFNGEVFGTTKVSCVFKAKDALEAPLSFRVDPSVAFWNTFAIDCQRLSYILKEAAIA